MERCIIRLTIFLLLLNLNYKYMTMKIKMLNYQTPQAVEVMTECFEVLCSSKTELPGASTEDLGGLEDFFGTGN